jgi:hypothetical protein
MKNVLKTMALLTLGASITPILATEEQSKPNTVAAYAEAGISGLLMVPAMTAIAGCGELFMRGYLVYGTLSLVGLAASCVLVNTIPDKLFSKATRERAYEIRKAWVTLEMENGKLPKQKIIDAIYFLGCFFAPLVAASYFVKIV